MSQCPHFQLPYYKMKRKRTSDYPNGDDVEDRDWDKNSDTASFSTSSSIVYQPTAKRRNLDFGDVDETNSVYETGDEDCELWLIRKPKGVSIWKCSSRKENHTIQKSCSSEFTDF